MKRISLLLIIIFFLKFKAYGQVWKEYSSFYPAIGLQLGSSGVGLQGSYPITPEFNFRLGGNFIPVVKLNIDNKVVEMKRSNVELMVDWQPLYGQPSWFACKWSLSLGAGYFFYNKVVKYVGSTKADNQPIDYAVEWSKFRPYLGTALNNIRVGYHFNLSVNAGYFFPTSDTKILAYAKNPAGIPHLRDRVNSFPYNVLPGLNGQVGLHYIFF